jgi:hypothetical protein
VVIQQRSSISLDLSPNGVDPGESDPFPGLISSQSYHIFIEREKNHKGKSPFLNFLIRAAVLLC